ncbi:MAG TPA: hypothetical protein VGM89_15585 [Puia sp.]|jgi:hypothetical protein
MVLAFNKGFNTLLAVMAFGEPVLLNLRQFEVWLGRTGRLDYRIVFSDEFETLTGRLSIEDYWEERASGIFIDLEKFITTCSQL